MDPLLLPNVLEETFSCLEPSVLHKCRLVCSSWNIEACLALKMKRRQHPAIVKTVERLQSYQDIFANADCICHSAYQFQCPLVNEKDKESIENFIYQFGFHVKTLNVVVGKNNFDSSLLLLVLQNLPYLDTLEIFLSYWASMNLFENDDDFCLFPNIKHLAVDFASYSYVKDKTTPFMHDLFTSLVNLETISYLGGCDRSRTPSKFKIALTEILLSAPEGTLNKLANLNYLMKLNEDNLKLLITRGFPVTSIAMDLFPSETDDVCPTSETLEYLMIQLSPTLRKLSIDFPWRKELSWTFRFPTTMPHLHTLCLSAFEGVVVDLLFTVKNTLVVLELSQMDLEDAFPRGLAAIASCFGSTPPGSNNRRNSSEPLICSRMYYLKLEFCSSQSPQVLRRIARLCPGIKKLHITHVTNDIMRSIYKELPGVQYLMLNGFTLSDEGLVGISEAVIKSEGLLSNLNIEDVTDLRQFAYIGDLKELRRLYLNAHRITDVSVAYGIVKCCTLDYLSLDYTSTTDAAIRIFEKILGRKRLYETEERIVI